MAERLIINARRRIGWRRRVLSDVGTALLWVGWIYLWLPVIRKFYQVVRVRMNLETAALEVLDVVAPISFQHSIEALLGTTALLLLWSMLPRGRLRQDHVDETLEDYAGYFALDQRTIEAGRNSRVSVVSHDDSGAIVGIETRA